jgi:HEAT repeat protein
LSSAAEKDPFWRIRRAALSLVAAIVSPDPPRGQERPPVKLDPATEALAMRLTKDQKSLIRADAIRLLGETQDAKYVSTYLAALNDRSYGVIDESARALALTKDARAFDALNKLAATSSWKGRIANAGLNGLAALGDRRGLDVALRMSADTSAPMNVRRTAFTVVGATGKGDQRAYDLISKMLKQTLESDSDSSPPARLIRAIVSLADPRGQEAFDMLKARYKDAPQFLNFVTQQEKAFQAAIKGQ